MNRLAEGDKGGWFRVRYSRFHPPPWFKIVPPATSHVAKGLSWASLEPGNRLGAWSLRRGTLFEVELGKIIQVIALIVA